jgi:thiamine pyrophosphokinase
LNKKEPLCSRRCVICAAGPVSDIEKLRPLLRRDDWVMAADGGIRLANRLGLSIDHIIADFDSVEREEAKGTGAAISELPVKKNDTDTMAAARLGLQKGFRDFLILGGSGGRMDHTMANLAVMMFLIKNGARAVLADENNMVEMLLPGRRIVEPAENARLSLLPYAGQVSGLYVRNAEYELENATLTPDFPLGVSNEFKDRPVEISFTKGILMIFISKD